jgi:hypothetical protein
MRTKLILALLVMASAAACGQTPTEARRDPAGSARFDATTDTTGRGPQGAGSGG